VNRGTSPKGATFCNGEGEKRSHGLRNCEASLRSKFSHGEDVHVTFGPNSRARRCCYAILIHETIEHRREIVI
jgi:hypothetical protein